MTNNEHKYKNYIDLKKFEGHTPGPWDIWYDGSKARAVQSNRNCVIQPTWTMRDGEVWEAWLSAKAENLVLITESPKLIAYARELEERNKQLEARIEKMQAAGDVLVQIAGIIGLCWPTTSFPAMGHIQEAVDNWRNA